MDGALAIDGSCGNGNDTLELAKAVGPRGLVFAFDIQDAAIQNTEKLLEDSGLRGRVLIFRHSHADMASKIPSEFHGKINAAMLNLGWLPNSGKNIITKPQTTLAALGSLKGLMEPNKNIVSVLSYRGHEGGAEEYEAVCGFAESRHHKKIGDPSNEKSPILFLFSV